MQCIYCGTNVSRARAGLGYETCLECGEQQARMVKHCVVPMAKSNYIVVSDKELLKGLNKYAKP